MEPELEVKQLHEQADSLAAQFKQGGGSHYIDEAIILDREALALCPPGHSARALSLYQLSYHLRDRYDQLGRMTDIEEAIVLSREALTLCPPGHPERPKPFFMLSYCLWKRYNQFGEMTDLDETISVSRDALALCAPGHPAHSAALNHVGVYLIYRYIRLGRMEDLNEAIILAGDAVASCPPGNSGRSSFLNNLSGYLSDRYELLRGMEDLDESIILGRDALALCPTRYPHRPTYLINLALRLSMRYKRLGSMEDLDEAIVLGRDTLALCPTGHPLRAIALGNIANYLQSRYERLGGMEDLDEAISLGRDALALRPPRNPGRSISLSNVASCLTLRYWRLGGMNDLDEAIVLAQDALALCSLGHPHWLESLRSLASYLRTRFIESRQLKDKEELFSLYAQIAHMTQTPSSADLSAARAWIRVAEEFQHPTTLLAYETYLRLLVHHVATLPSLPQHLDLLKDITSLLAVDAFSACIWHCSPTKAVELIEQGRGVFWSQLTRLRSPLDDVVASGPEGKKLAEKFTHLTLLIRAVLDSPGAKQHDHICRLNVDLERVVAGVRELPGLSRFLLPSLFSDLQQVASGGPVIIVNASEYGCDALVVLLDRDPVHIPLRIAKEDVLGLSSNLYTWTARAKLMSVTTHVAVILRELWDKVVSPIVDFLQTFHPIDSRIWWCPTSEFSLLPLHAAGPYRTGQRGLSDFYVSSYTSTLTALIRARQKPPSQSASPEQYFGFVGIGQANAIGESELHSVGVELANIGQRVDGRAMFTCIEGPDSCIPRVVEELKKNQWAHLACHGIPNRKEPFKSAFALADGRFTIEHIMRCELPNAQFAYLSACHTLVGDEECPDEMIHLASAMQFAGFRSVIGTMWAVDDVQAKKITSMFYDNMVDESGRLDHTRAAFALHKTMKDVRGISFDQRILYVHLGA